MNGHQMKEYLNGLSDKELYNIIETAVVRKTDFDDEVKNDDDWGEDTAQKLLSLDDNEKLEIIQDALDGWGEDVLMGRYLERLRDGINRRGEELAQEE